MRTAEARPVLAGSKVKWTLEQLEQDNQQRVRVDWLRFTMPLDAVVKHEPSMVDLTALDLLDQRGKDLVRMSQGVEPEHYTTGHMVATVAARQIVQLLACGIEVGTNERGMDFYSARTSLVFEGATVGHVLAGSKDQRQASTVHVNLFGSAMLHIGPVALAKLRALVEQAQGWITRVALSLDLWQGYSVLQAQAAYTAGEFDLRGKRPGQREIGSWTNGHSRTFEVGSRATGKMARFYEKGHEQFGTEIAAEWASGKKLLSTSLAALVGDWVRGEVELRNNHRIIDLDVLTRPADFFAGAYSFCARLLSELEVSAVAQSIATVPEVRDATEVASVMRTVRNAVRVMAPTIVALLEHGGDLLLEIVDRERHRVPRRLRGITPAALRQAFEKVAEAVAPAPAPSFIGAV